MTNSRQPAVRSCQLDIRTFSRPFVRPLVTSHGEWSIREGAIVRLLSQERVGYGELAPIPWFDSESLVEALTFCASLEGCLTAEKLAAIPERFPATQFALESAWVDLEIAESDPASSAPPSVLPDLPVCGLLPTGEAALQAWASLLEQGYSTLKWKIGVGERAAELRCLHQLAEVLPPHVELRLDANGGLDMAAAVDWLQACDCLSIEYLEQPLPPTEFDALLSLQREFVTPIALDESVATLPNLKQCIAQGWGGIVVIKPAICGFPSQVQQVCKTYQLDVVVSSALETFVGQQAAQRFAREIGSHRALGFGIDHLLHPVPSDWPAGLWKTSTPF